MGIPITIIEDIIKKASRCTNEGKFQWNIGKKSSWKKTCAELLHKDGPSNNYCDMQKEHKVLPKLMIDCFLQKGGGTDTISIDHKVFLYFLVTFEKVNLPRYMFHHMIWALKESHKNDRRQVPYGRLLSEIFYQGGLISKLKKTGVVSDKDLGTMTGKIINGRTLRYMNIVEKAIVEENDMKKSDVISDLMEDFPPISKEDNPEVLTAYVITHFKGKGDIINYSVIPDTMGGAPLRVKGKRKSKKVVEESEPKPKKQKKSKKAPKLNVIEPSLPIIHKEIADLGPVEVLNKRTKGETSEATASQPKAKAHKKGKKIRKMKVSQYVKEENAQVEETSTLTTRMEKRMKVAA